MSSNKPFVTYSLSELFAIVHQDENGSTQLLIERMDCDELDIYTKSSHQPVDLAQHMVTSRSTEGWQDYGHRVALWNEESKTTLVFARLKSNLYRHVGTNAGHYAGAFKRHDKRRQHRLAIEMKKAEMAAADAHAYSLSSRVHGVVTA